jgi:hypothetical protein
VTVGATGSNLKCWQLHITCRILILYFLSRGFFWGTLIYFSFASSSYNFHNRRNAISSSGPHLPRKSRFHAVAHFTGSTVECVRNPR